MFTSTARFNPLQPPFDPVQAEKERMIENIAVMDLGLDAPDEAYTEYQEMFKDASINVLMEAQSNRESRPYLVSDPDGGYMIDYRKPIGERMQMLNLSAEDVAAISADLGLQGNNVTLFNLEKKQQEVFAQQTLLNEYQAEMERLKMTDLPAYKQVYKQQEDLLNKLVDEYEALYNELGEE